MSEQMRPVNGEILAANAQQRPLRGHGDVVDADFESVSARRPQPAVRAEQPASLPQGLDVLRQAGAGDGAARGGPLFWTGGLIAIAAAFWISGGHALMPSFSAPSFMGGQAGLELSGLSTREEKSGRLTMLQIDGQVFNPGNSAQALPGLIINVEAKSGSVTRYALGTGQTGLEAGERYDFSSRIQAPEGGIKRVTVTFGESGAAN